MTAGLHGVHVMKMIADMLRESQGQIRSAVSLFPSSVALIFLSRQRRDKVRLPSPAPVSRERLFKMVRVRTDVCKEMSNQDGFALKRFVVDELATAVFEFADHGRRYRAVVAGGKIEAPTMRLGIVEAQVQFFQVNGWEVGFEFHQIGAAIPHFPDDNTRFHFDPGRRAG